MIKSKPVSSQTGNHFPIKTNTIDQISWMNADFGRRIKGTPSFSSEI
jgi:hypothetical protein